MTGEQIESRNRLMRAGAYRVAFSEVFGFCNGVAVFALGGKSHAIKWSDDEDGLAEGTDKLVEWLENNGVMPENPEPF